MSNAVLKVDGLFYDRGGMGYNVQHSDFGALGDGSTDDTEAVQEAIDAAYVDRVSSVVVPPGPHVIDGTLDIPQGVVLRGSGNSGEIDPGSPNGIAWASLLYKPSDGQDGPIARIRYGNAGLVDLGFKHSKVGGATTGIIQLGDDDDVQSGCFHSRIRGCHILGHFTFDIDTEDNCKGIYMPPGDSPSGARYYNIISDNIIVNTDVALALRAHGNGNIFSHNITRDAYIHVDLNGGGAPDFHVVTDNAFIGNIHNNQSDFLPTPPVTFRLRNMVRGNVFLGYNTEAVGTEFLVDDDCTGNIFLGYATTTEGSDWKSNQNLRFLQPTNLHRYLEQYFVSESGASKFVFGRGSLVRHTQPVTGTLPELENDAGTLDTSASSRKIITFPVSKESFATLTCKLKIHAYSLGMHVIEVDFIYRNTSSITGAGQLCVTRVVNKGNGTPEVTGLYFIKGTTGTPRNFAIALVGGNNTGNSFSAITVDLEMDGVAYSNTTIQMDLLRSDFSFATDDVEADDVTDGVTLLATGDTVI